MIHAPIAITGIGCRFPEATGPEAFWGLLTSGGDAIKEIPANRFDVDAFYDARPGIPGKLYSRWGGFLDQVDQFDPYFFGISPREAAGMDPQHRLLLEVAWEALEDAGQVPEQLLGQQVGVFVGMCTNDYMNVLSDLSLIDIYFAAGNARSVLSGRLSYALGLQGPSLVVDTACSIVAGGGAPGLPEPAERRIHARARRRRQPGAPARSERRVLAGADAGTATAGARPSTREATASCAATASASSC